MSNFEDKRFFIEDTTIYEITADSPEEARAIWAKFFEDGYEQGMGLKIEFSETKLLDEDHEEIEPEDIA